MEVCRFPYQDKSEIRPNRIHRSFPLCRLPVALSPFAQEASASHQVASASMAVAVSAKALALAMAWAAPSQDDEPLDSSPHRK